MINAKLLKDFSNNCKKRLLDIVNLLYSEKFQTGDQPTITKPQKHQKQRNWTYRHNNQSNLTPKHFSRKVDPLMKKCQKIHWPIVNG